MHRPFVHCLAVTVAVHTDHVPNVYIVAPVCYLALISTSCLTGCRGSLHFSLLSACHVVRATPPAVPRPLMRSPALCDALYSLFRLNAALGHSLRLGITTQRVTINPTWFCDLPFTDILLSSLGNPIDPLLLLFSVAVCMDHLYIVWF